MNKQTDLLTLLKNKDDAIAVFTGEKLDGFLKEIESDALNFVGDISTDMGRKQIATKAYSVAKNKVKIDEIGKELVSDWKRKAKLVDESRKKARDFLDELKETVRKPLTDWEKEEAKREQAEKDRIELIDAWNNAIKENEIVEREKEIARKEAALQYQEAKRLEDERLEKEEHDRIIRERKIAEQARLCAEQEAQEKIENERRLKIEAELKAEREKIEAEAMRKKEIEDVKIQAEYDKQQAVEKERERVWLIEQKIKETEVKEKQESERKAANLKHRKKINNEALACFMEQGIKENPAKEIIRMIANKLIKNITINY
jgi:colicin import membrane protein